MNPSIKVLSGHVEYGDVRIVYYYLKQNGIDSGVYFHSHCSWELHFSALKKKSYMLESGLLEVDKKQLLVISPGTVHGAIQDLEGTYVLNICLEKVNGESGFYKCFKEMLEKAALQAVPISESLIEKVKQFINMEVGDSVKGYCQKQQLLEAITIELFETIDGETFLNASVHIHNPEEHTEMVLELMMEDPYAELKDIAEAVGYSVRHTARLIEKNYQMSLLENRRWKILKNAARLIKIGKLSHEEIAMHSGFTCTEDMYQELEKYEQLIQGKKGRKGKTDEKTVERK